MKASSLSQLAQCSQGNLASQLSFLLPEIRSTGEGLRIGGAPIGTEDRMSVV